MPLLSSGDLHASFDRSVVRAPCADPVPAGRDDLRAGGDQIPVEEQLGVRRADAEIESGTLLETRRLEQRDGHRLGLGGDLFTAHRAGALRGDLTCGRIDQREVEERWIGDAVDDDDQAVAGVDPLELGDQAVLVRAARHHRPDQPCGQREHLLLGDEIDARAEDRSPLDRLEGPARVGSAVGQLDREDRHPGRRGCERRQKQEAGHRRSIYSRSVRRLTSGLLATAAVACGDRVAVLELPEAVSGESIIAVERAGGTTIHAAGEEGVPLLVPAVGRGGDPVRVVVARTLEPLSSLGLVPGPVPAVPEGLVRAIPYGAIFETIVEDGVPRAWAPLDAPPEVLADLRVRFECPTFEVERRAVDGTGATPVGARAPDGSILASFGASAYVQIGPDGSVTPIEAEGARTALAAGRSIWLGDAGGHLYEGVVDDGVLSQSRTGTVASGRVERILVEGGRVHSLGLDGTYGVTEPGSGFTERARLDPSSREFFVGGLVGGGGGPVYVAKEDALLEVEQGVVRTRTSLGGEIADLSLTGDGRLLVAMGGVDLRLLEWPSLSQRGLLTNLAVSSLVDGTLFAYASINGVLSVESLDPQVSCGPIPIEDARITQVLSLGESGWVALSSLSNGASEVLFLRRTGSR